MSRFGAVCNALKKLRLVNHILGGLQIVKNDESIRGTTLIYQQNGCYTQCKHKQLIAGDRRKHKHTLQYFRNITLLCFGCKRRFTLLGVVIYTSVNQFTPLGDFHHLAYQSSHYCELHCCSYFDDIATHRNALTLRARYNCMHAHMTDAITSRVCAHRRSTHAYIVVVIMLHVCAQCRATLT